MVAFATKIPRISSPDPIIKMTEDRRHCNILTLVDKRTTCRLSASVSYILTLVDKRTTCRLSASVSYVLIAGIMAGAYCQ